MGCVCVTRKTPHVARRVHLPKGYLKRLFSVSSDCTLIHVGLPIAKTCSFWGIPHHGIFMKGHRDKHRLEHVGENERNNTQDAVPTT